jgi:hypothetical protein
MEKYYQAAVVLRPITLPKINQLRYFIIIQIIVDTILHVMYSCKIQDIRYDTMIQKLYLSQFAG